MTPPEVVSAISQLVFEYADALDARDWARLEQLLSKDVLLTRGGETTEGRDAFHQAYRPFLEAGTRGSRHVVTNLRVEETGPGQARARALFEASTFLPEVTRRVMGRYEDDFQLSDGRWQFTHKRNAIEWAVDLPAAQQI